MQIPVREASQRILITTNEIKPGNNLSLLSSENFVERGLHAVLFTTFARLSFSPPPFLSKLFLLLWLSIVSLNFPVSLDRHHITHLAQDGVQGLDLGSYG